MTIEDRYPGLQKAADYYGGIGWKILPVHGVGQDTRCTCGKAHTDPKDIAKHPVISNWQNDATDDRFQIDTWWHADYRYNVGVSCRSSGFLVIDVDPRSGGFESLDKFDIMHPDLLTPTVEARTGEYSWKGETVRGIHLYYSVAESENLIGNLKSLGLPGIDIKHNGYVLLSPSNHLSGVQYEWKEGHAPWEIGMAPASEKMLEVLRKGGGSRRSGGGRNTSQDPWEWVNDLSWGENKLDIDKFLAEGIDEGSRAIDIYAMACAVANKLGTDALGSEATMNTMRAFNYEKVRPPLEATGPNSIEMHTERAIEFVRNNPKTDRLANGFGKDVMDWANKTVAVPAPAVDSGSGVSVITSLPAADGEDYTSDPDDDDDTDIDYVNTAMAGTIGGQVTHNAYRGRRLGKDPLDVPRDQDALTEDEGGTPGARSMSDTGNGRRLVDTFGSIMRYTIGLGFFHWSGGYWEPDTENLKTRETTKRLATIIGREVMNYEDEDKQSQVIKWAGKARSNGSQNAAIESAQSDPRISVGVEDWDADNHLLGVVNGVVNLKTGELMKGRPDLYITRRAPVKYTPGIRNSRWMNFLDFGTGGDKEYQDWLQRAVGYSLTGMRTHDVMFLVYGPGGTGKNVLVEAIVKAMGTKEYAWPMDSQILAQGDGKANAADLYHWAELRGRRLVWVDELPESERLKENSVKKLTGSSEISARSPGEKPFTFNSRAKLWVTTNHRPIISDDAMWRRIRPIPWLNVPTTPDPGLKEYIFDPEGGLPGVLAWAVEGAMKVLNSTETDSLGWCKVVKEAAEVYKANEDRIGMFLNEETIEVPGADLPIKTLYPEYAAWSEDRGEKAMSTIAFQRKLTDRGLEVTGQGRNAVMAGRSLVPKTAAGESYDWDRMSRNF